MSSLVNIEAFKQFLKDEFDDNLTFAEKKIGISKSTLCLLKKGERDIGKNTLLKLKKYCEQNEIELNKILFF